MQISPPKLEKTSSQNKRDKEPMYYELAESSWSDEEIRAIQGVIDKGRFTMGESVRQFENDFAKKFGCKYALMISSGSTANLVGIALLFYKNENPLQLLEHSLSFRSMARARV